MKLHTGCPSTWFLKTNTVLRTLFSLRMNSPPAVFVTVEKFSGHGCPTFFMQLMSILLVPNFLLPLKPHPHASLCPWASTSGGEIPGSGIAGLEGLHIKILIESVKLLSDKVILICVHEVCRQCQGSPRSE